MSKVDKYSQKGKCCCQHNICLKADIMEISKTKQPWTISIDGVEIPTYKAMQFNQEALELEIKCYKFLLAAQSVVILIILIVQLLK